LLTSGIPMPHRAGADRVDGDPTSTGSTVHRSVLPTEARGHSKTARVALAEGLGSAG